MRALALAATYSLRDKLCESLRVKVMDMIGDRLISHEDFTHIPSEIQNSILQIFGCEGRGLSEGVGLTLPPPRVRQSRSAQLFSSATPTYR